MGNMGDMVRRRSMMVTTMMACCMRDADDELELDALAVALARERKISQVCETLKYDGNVFSKADSCNRVRK